MTRALATLVASLLACAVWAVEPAKPGHLIAADVRVELKKIESLLTDGPATMALEVAMAREFKVTEYKTQRHFVAVVFPMEGYGMGNGSVQYLVVFERLTERPSEDFPFHVLQLRALLKVGKDYERTFDSMRVDGHRISLAGKAWVEGHDAHCCPSAPATATFEFDKHSIVEISSGKK